jgi:hypothetical protein
MRVRSEFDSTWCAWVNAGNQYPELRTAGIVHPDPPN